MKLLVTMDTDAVRLAQNQKRYLKPDGSGSFIWCPLSFAKFMVENINDDMIMGVTSVAEYPDPDAGKNHSFGTSSVYR